MSFQTFKKKTNGNDRNRGNGESTFSTKEKVEIPDISNIMSQIDSKLVQINNIVPKEREEENTFSRGCLC